MRIFTIPILLLVVISLDGAAQTPSTPSALTVIRAGVLIDPESGTTAVLPGLFDAHTHLCTALFVPSNNGLRPTKGGPIWLLRILTSPVAGPDDHDWFDRDRRSGEL